MSTAVASCGASSLASFFERAIQRHRLGHAQVLRQAGQRHFAQRALVILGGEARQRDPALGQRRELAAYGQRILQFLGQDFAVLLDGDDQGHDLAPRERHQRQLARDRLLSGFTWPAVIEAAVQRRVEHDFEYAV
jgi:hypothetical protein